MNQKASDEFNNLKNVPCCSIYINIKVLQSLLMIEIWQLVLKPV